MADFATIIRICREESKLSWRAWAKKCGVSLSSVQRYESGEMEPSLTVLRRISKNLRIPISVLSGQEPLRMIPGPETKLRDPSQQS